MGNGKKRAKKKTGLLYVGQGKYVGRAIKEILEDLGFKKVKKIMVCSDCGAFPFGHTQSVTAEYIIRSRDVAIAFQHEGFSVVDFEFIETIGTEGATRCGGPVVAKYEAFEGRIIRCGHYNG